MTEHVETTPFFDMQELFGSSAGERIPKIVVATDGSVLGVSLQHIHVQR